MVGWHQSLNGREFEQALGDGEGQGSLVCCSPWGHRESDTTECLNLTELIQYLEKGMATHSTILAWKNLMDRGAWWATVHGVTKSQTRLSD